MGVFVQELAMVKHEVVSQLLELLNRVLLEQGFDDAVSLRLGDPEGVGYAPQSTLAPPPCKKASVRRLLFHGQSRQGGVLFKQHQIAESAI